MGDDIDGASSFHAGGLIGIHDMDGNPHPNLRTFPKPQKIHVDGQILDRVKLEVARDDALLGTIDVKLVDGGEKAPAVDALLELGVI